MNVVDSSGSLEYFADGPNAGHFLSPLKDPDSDFKDIPGVKYFAAKK